MDTSTEKLISVLRIRMEKMSDNERLGLIAALMDNYCEHCGGVYGGGCHCWNDN